MKPYAATKPADSDADQQMTSAVKIARDLNPNKRGIVLPVFTDSPDTVRFTIYRAEAIGARGFGPPEAIANLEYDNPKDTTFSGAQLEMIDTSQPNVGLVEPEQPEMYQTSATWTSLFNKTNHAQLKTSTSSHPDLIYFDAGIEEGCTYKYWISAWDSWNNESTWSQAVSMAVPTNAEPQDPNELFIAMHLSPSAWAPA